MKQWLWLSLCTATTACATSGRTLSPQALDEGIYEAAIDTSVLIVDRGVGAQPLPWMQLELRRGMGSGFEAGARIDPLSLGLDLKKELFRHEGWAAAWIAGPRVSFAAVTNRDIDVMHYALEAGLLGGYRGERLQLHAGLHTQSELRQGAGRFRFVEVVGISLGLGPMPIT